MRWIVVVAATVAACGQSVSYPQMPTLAADPPMDWLQFGAKTFTAQVIHPHIEGWDLLEGEVRFAKGDWPGWDAARSGVATVGPSHTLTFTVPSAQDDFMMDDTVTFQWKATVRLVGGVEQIPIQNKPQVLVVRGCVMGDGSSGIRPIRMPDRTIAEPVFNPTRLKPIKPCASFDGTVHFVCHEFDGDTHINIKPDAGQEGVLIPGNHFPQFGDLVAEIISADRPGCTPGSPPPRLTPGLDCVPRGGTPPDDPFPVPGDTAADIAAQTFGTCTGAAMTDPGVGMHVRVIGPLVRDVHDAGPDWVEIHPIWAINALP